MNDEKEWHELRRKVMYSEDIDEEANHWKEIDRRLKLLEEIQKSFKNEKKYEERSSKKQGEDTI